MIKAAATDRQKNRLISIMALFPFIMAILDPYTVSPGGDLFICDIVIVLSACYFIAVKHIRLYKPMFFLLLADAVLTLVSFLLTDSGRTSLFLAVKVGVVFLMYLTVYSSVWSYDIKREFFKMAEIIGLICAALAICQFIFASLGFDFYDGKLFLPLGEGSYFGGLYDKNTNDLRVHSFFEEPSYLAFFEIPITVHLIQNKKYLKAAVCALSCIISGSMIGIIGMIFSVIAILLLDSSMKRNYKIQLVLLLAAAVAVLIYIYNTSASFRSLIDYYINRGTTLEESAQRENSSFSQRIKGNSALFSSYGAVNRLIGVGFNQYPRYFGILKDYSNDFVSNLLNFGYIGILAMAAALIAIFKYSSAQGRIFWIVFVMLISVDHSWFGSLFFYILTWVVLNSGSKENKKQFVTVEY